jgi:hypothetical protein
MSAGWCIEGESMNEGHGRGPLKARREVIRRRNVALTSCRFASISSQDGADISVQDIERS